jgi:flagellar hook-length control protein FliK
MQIKPLAAPLAAPASAPSASSASMSDASFARHLESRRSESAPAKAPPPKPVAHAQRDEDKRGAADKRDGAGRAAERSERSAKPHDAARASAKTAAKADDAGSPANDRARGAAGTGKAASPHKAPEAAAEREADDPAVAASTDDATAAVPAALAEWLARLAPPEPSTGAAKGEASASELPGPARAAAVGDERSTASANPLEALTSRRLGSDKTVGDAAASFTRIGSDVNDSRGADPAAMPSPTALAAELHAEASAAIGSAVRALRGDAPQGGDAAPGNALAAIGTVGAFAGAPHAAPPAAAAAPPSVTIGAPFGTPAFAPALAASVSLLARDGVQEARLQLHPAELGPIAVQIALDGVQARVDFTAEVAATRHAIEAGLPELASALREAGLTLAGGGVFQQARDAQQGAPQDGTNHAGGSRGQAGEAHEDGLPARSVAQRRVAVGGVDEYA